MFRGGSLFRGLAIAATIAFVATASGEPAETCRGGIRMNYTKIAIANLPIGAPVSMRHLANLPLIVGNNSPQPASITLSVVAPASPRAGFEAIPDPSWVRLETNMLNVAGLGEVSLDVTVRMPDEPSLLGRKWQADIIAESAAAGAAPVRYRVSGSLLVSTAPVPNLSALAQPLGDADFALEPPRVDVTNVTAGQIIRLAIAPMLVNRTGMARRYAITAVDPGGTSVSPDSGSRSGNPQDVRGLSSEVALQPGASAVLPIEIRVPAAADLTAGPLFHLVAVRTAPDESVTRYLKIYLFGR